MRQNCCGRDSFARRPGLRGPSSWCQTIRNRVDCFSHGLCILADLKRLNDLDRAHHDKPHAGNEHKHDDRIKRPNKNDEAGDHRDDAKNGVPTPPDKFCSPIETATSETP